MRRRAGATVALLVFALAGCGGDDGSGGGNEGDERPAVFPAGGRVPEQRTTGVRQAAREASCELRDTPSRGEADRQHTRTSDERVQYRSNPPTLGRHAPPAAADGLYQAPPPDESLVHTMEHGRVIVWARPGLPAEARSALRALFEEDSYQVVLTPRAKMPYEVAATAWNGDPQPGGIGRTLACPKWNDNVVDALRAFRDEHRGRGPEPIP